MRSLGWAVIHYNWCSYKIRTQIHTKGRLCEHAWRRHDHLQDKEKGFRKKIPEDNLILDF